MAVNRDVMMAFLKKLYHSAAEKMTGVFLGEPVREWGVVHKRQGTFYSESISVDLYRKNGQLILWLKTIYKSRFSYNSYGFAINIHDLHHFVETLQARYRELSRLAGMARPRATRTRDKLPFAHRLLLKAIFGVRSSKLLLDLRDPHTRETEYRFYGFVTRKSDPKIFIQSDLDISSRKGTVISGECLAAALQVLADYLDSEESTAAWPGDTAIGIPGREAC
jgi:hypothetical protein